MRRASPLALIPLVLSTAAPSVAGEVRLFNGKDLSGWTGFLDKKGPNEAGTLKAEDVWTVHDGVLRCSGVPNGYLRTQADYGDYVLKLEWRWAEKPGNSGVFLRIMGEDGIWPKTIEAQLKSGDAGDLILANGATLETDPARRDPANPRHRRKIKAAEKPVGEWNEYEIRVHRDRIVVKMNGELVNEGTGAEPVAGKIGLQSEGSPVEFRNIRLTTLR
jgi:hypothetical protein